MRTDTFRAIADPTRREIIGMLIAGPLTMNAVSENFTISRTAVYKHIKILEECGLIVISQNGRERHCAVRPEKLLEVSDWIEPYKKYT